MDNKIDKMNKKLKEMSTRMSLMEEYIINTLNDKKDNIELFKKHGGGNKHFINEFEVGPNETYMVSNNNINKLRKRTVV